MTAQELFEKAEGFAGTTSIAFAFGGKILAIGRMVEGGPIMLYERDQAGEPEGYRHALATFAGNSEAARAGAFIATMGEKTWRPLT